MDSLICVTHRVEETEALGMRLAALAAPGTVIALHGDLATGKTCLVRGMTRYFADEADVHSPTFTLVNEYGKDRILYHLDLYRLRPEELLTLGYEDLIETNAVCHRMGGRAAGFLPEKRLDVYLAHGGGDTRILRFENHCLAPEAWDAFVREVHTTNPDA